MNSPIENKGSHTFEYVVGEQVFHAECFFGGHNGRVVIYPDWEGCHTNWARQIAAEYAATCNAEVILTDHYGVELPHPSFETAYELNQDLLANPERSRVLFRGIMDALAPKWQCDGPLFVVGFCSGGSFALETGRAASNVDAAVCVHGNPQTPLPLRSESSQLAAEDQLERPIFMVVHGGDDPLITGNQLSEFEREMRNARARWVLHVISGAKHSFTRFDSTRANHAIGYSRRADLETRHLVHSQMNALREFFAS